MRKLCVRCQKNKSTTEFHNNVTTKDGLQKRCKDCQKSAVRMSHTKPEVKQRTNERNKQKILDLRKQVDDIKSVHGCCLCNEDHPACLDLHHTEDNKVDSVAMLVLSKSARLINDELKKCVVLCANCHRKVHAGVLELEVESGYITASVM